MELKRIGEIIGTVIYLLSPFIIGDIVYELFSMHPWEYSFVWVFWVLLAPFVLVIGMFGWKKTVTFITCKVKN